MWNKIVEFLKAPVFPDDEEKNRHASALNTDSVTRARLSEERYRLIASIMSDYAFSVQYGSSGEIIDQWLSGAFEQITGYSPTEYFARGGWTSILHPDDKEQDKQDMAQLRANQKVITEVRLIQKGGAIRWVRSYGHPIWDEKRNQLAGIYGAVQDITDRRQIELSLHQRESVLEAVAISAERLFAAPEWSMVINDVLERVGSSINASHAYLFENRKLNDGRIVTSIKFEWTAPHLPSDLGVPTYTEKYLDPYDLTSWYQNMNQGLPFIGDAKSLSEEEYRRLVSREMLALLDVPIYIDNQWWGIIGFDDVVSAREWTNAEVDVLKIAANVLGAAIKRQIDETVLQDELEQRKALIAELELKNAEAETLRESTAIVAATLEQTEAVDRILEQLARVIHYDSASVQLLRGAMLEIVSFREPGLNRNDVGMQFEVNESDPAYQVIQGTLPYTLFEDVQISTSVFTESPHNNIHSWMAVPLKVKGRIIGVIALDGQRPSQFTERDAQLALTYANQVAIALENARLFSELQEKFAERQVLIEELEHKNAELERFTYTVSHDLRSPLVTIKGFLGYLEGSASAGNMESFRKDMARISGATDRMDNLLKDLLELSRVGRLIHKPQEVLFGDLVNEAVEIVHGRLEKNNITLQTQPNLPLVNVDKLRLIEVLQNLIDNAAKYMGGQKNPMIEIGTNGLDASGKPIFFVRDNGIGIAAEYHERIFGLFDKLDAVSEGTGIGLALVKRIIEIHAGRIWVESEVGKGSIFCFTLPQANDRAI